MMETLAHWYSSESAWQEVSNIYQHDRVEMVFKNLCILVLRTKVAFALEGLSNISKHLTLLLLRLLSYKKAKDYKNHLNSVMLVFIEKLSLSAVK